jgi:hypothetical protein
LIPKFFNYVLHQNLASELSDMERSCRQLDSTLESVESLGQGDTFEVRPPLYALTTHSTHFTIRGVI